MLTKNKDPEQLDTDSLAEILEGMTRAAKGDFAARVKPPACDSSLFVIAEAFNEMMEGLKDFTDYERIAHGQLERLSKNLTRIFEASNDIIVYLNRFGTIIDVNKSVKQILGYAADELKGKHFARTGVLVDGESGSFVAAFAQAMETGRMKQVAELEARTRDGETVWLEANTRIIKSGDDIEGAVIVMRDITRRHAAEMGSRDQKNLLHSVIASLDDYVFVLDNEMRFVEYHPSQEHPDPFLQGKPDEHVGKTMPRVFPRSMAEEFERRIKNSVKTRKTQEFEYPVDLPGSRVWLNVRISPLFDADGAAAGATVVMRDTSAAKRMEQALAESEKRYRKIFENSPQGFILLDTEGRIIDVNRRICDWLGFEPDELIGRDHLFYPFLKKQGKVTAMKMFFQRLSGKDVPAYELEFVTKGGETFLGEVKAMQLRDDQGRILQVLAMITDITNRSGGRH